MEYRRRLMGKKREVDYSRQYFTLVALQAGTFRHSNFDVDYSVDDGNTWSTLSAGSSTPTVQAGTKVMFRGNITPSTSYGVGRFTGTNNFEAEGNVMSLLYSDNFVGQKDLTGKDYVFYDLLYNTSYLQSAKNLSLPATTLSSNCYRSMFTGCTSLIAAPELPATTLADYCYNYMFHGCTSLTTAPELPATTLASNCYESMFGYCTSLIAAPELPATTLATYCYQNMFNNCTSLIAAPELPAMTLVSSCYANMFYGCTSLTTTPELPATTLVKYCYEYMFYGCTSLTTAPELPATTLVKYCYEYMFYNCSKLNYIKAMFTTIPNSSYTSNWVRGVAASGTFVKNSSASWNVTGVNGVPSGWTVQTASS